LEVLTAQHTSRDISDLSYKFYGEGSADPSGWPGLP